jgi:hypothetical protein
MVEYEKMYSSDRLVGYAFVAAWDLLHLYAHESLSDHM